MTLRQRYIMLTLWTSSLLLLSTVTYSAASDDAFYELRGEESCSGIGVEDRTVDILCSLTLPEDKCTNKSMARIHWFFSSTTARFAISDGEKFGIWDETEPVPGVISSLLRVRRIDPDSDAGMFTCALTCQTTDPVDSSKLELCVQDSATGLISCSQATTEDSCTHVFSNGQCDEHCDSEDQLFDGGDCDSYNNENCAADSGCDDNYQNGFCNRNCSSSQCGFDGGDCLQTTQSITRETLAVIIPTFYTQQQISKLSRHISVLISTLVNQNADPEPWSATENDGIHVTYLNPVVFQIAQSNLTILHYRLVPQSCVDMRRCFLRVTSAAKYISHQLFIDSNRLNSSVAAVGFKSQVDACYQRKESISPNKPGNEIKTYNIPNTSAETPEHRGVGVGGIIGAALCGVALLVLVIGIVVACRYRKIAKEREKEQTKQKQSQVKAYLDTIPDITEQTDTSAKSPMSSISTSVTSQDNIIPRTNKTRSYGYTTSNNGMGDENV